MDKFVFSIESGESGKLLEVHQSSMLDGKEHKRTFSVFLPPESLFKILRSMSSDVLVSVNEEGKDEAYGVCSASFNVYQGTNSGLSFTLTSIINNIQFLDAKFETDEDMGAERDESPMAISMALFSSGEATPTFCNVRDTEMSIRDILTKESIHSSLSLPKINIPYFRDNEGKAKEELLRKKFSKDIKASEDDGWSIYFKDYGNHHNISPDLKSYVLSICKFVELEGPVIMSGYDHKHNKDNAYALEKNGDLYTYTNEEWTTVESDTDYSNALGIINNATSSGPKGKIIEKFNEFKSNLNPSMA